MYEVKTTFIRKGKLKEIYDYFFTHKSAIQCALCYYDKDNCVNSQVYKNGSFVFSAREFIDYMYEMMEDENNG